MDDKVPNTVLVIDDNPSNLKLLHELLSSNGYRVRVADSPKLGLESALTTPPDIILTDVKMPEMDGYNLCQELKSYAKTKSIPVIFISASTGAINKVKAFEVGGMDYISKPFDTTEVIARIKNHLQLSTLQKQIQNSLDTSQNILQAIMNNSPAAIYIKDLQGRYMMVNKEYERVVKLSNERIIGKTVYDVFPKRIAANLIKHDHEVIDSSLHKQYEETFEIEDSERVYLSLKFPLIEADGNIFAICGISTDITMRKRAEAELEHLATYDTLTELPNRSLFTELLKRALAFAERDKTRHAILFIDLDNFKNVNDSFGHHIGDILLKLVAKRLKECTRITDTISRMGGDEFVLLMQRINHPSEAAEVSNKIIQALAPAFKIKNHTAFITPSIGIVITPDNGCNAQNLLRDADTAMYHAKNKGRNTYQFFTEEMNQHVLKRMEIEKELHLALEKEHIIPYYQPKIDTNTGKIIGIEALARWQHQELGDITPNTFIPVAEESNLIITLDRYILKTVVQQFAPLINDGSFSGTVSINLTAHHFYQDLLLDYIDQILKEHHFPAAHLELEITERLMMKNADEAITLMHELHDRGIQLSIDDFGTGYSSLSYLKRFPVNSLKIDISFIRDINKSKADKNLVASIINLAQGQNLKCIAEGVETIEQAKILQQLNCDSLQGYLFSHAVDFDTISEHFKNKKMFTDYF